MPRARLPGDTRAWSRRGPSPSESPHSAKLYLEAKLGGPVAASLLRTASEYAARPPRYDISAEKARKILRLARGLMPLISELSSTRIGCGSTAVRMLGPCLGGVINAVQRGSESPQRVKALQTLRDAGPQTLLAYDVLAFLYYVTWTGSVAELSLPKYEDLSPTLLMALAVAVGVEEGTGSPDRDVAKIEADRCFDRWRKTHEAARRVAETLLDLKGRSPPPKAPRPPAAYDTRAMAEALRRAAPRPNVEPTATSGFAQALVARRQSRTE